MKVKLLGHACLYVELEEARLLMDPWLEPDMLGGQCRRFPDPGQISFDVPLPTHLLISHHHWDHVHPKTLHRMPRSIPVYIPPNPQLRAILEEMEFETICELVDWEQVELGASEFFMATPSHVPFGEIGFYVEGKYGAIWNLVDCVFEKEDVVAMNQFSDGRLKIVFAPYQSYDEMGVLMRRRLNRQDTVLLKNASLLSSLEVDMVVPAADGLFYPQSPYMNARGFLSTPFEFVDVLLEMNPEQRCVVPLIFDEFRLVQEGIAHVRPLKLATSEILALYEEFRSFQNEPSAAPYDFSGPEVTDESADMLRKKLVARKFEFFSREALELFERLEARFELFLEPGKVSVLWDFPEKTVEIQMDSSWEEPNGNAWMRIHMNDLARLLKGQNLLNILMQSDRLHTGGDTPERAYRALDMLWANGLDDASQLKEWVRNQLKV